MLLQRKRPGIWHSGVLADAWPDDRPRHILCSMAAGIPDLGATDNLRAFFRTLANMQASSTRTLQEIADRGGISKTSAHNVAHGKGEPKPDTIRAFLIGCGADKETAEARVQLYVRLLHRTMDEPQTVETWPAAQADTEQSVLQNLTRIPLVQKWAAQTSPAAKAQINELVRRACVMLDQAHESAPAYTHHGSKHSVRVIENASQLLGGRVAQIHWLEASMVIVAAFYHDVGTVSMADEAYAVDIHPAGLNTEVDRLDLIQSDYPGSPLARLLARLGSMPSDLFVWDGIPVRQEIEKICWVQATSSGLLQLSALRSNFRDADARFCAALLRLAADLDFCVRRDPRPVYRKLGLAPRSSPGRNSSDVEWLNRLRPKRFDIKPRGDWYPVAFAASPDHPLIEHDAGKVLDELESDFVHCGMAKSIFSPRWSSVHLPGRIDRSQIISDGYTYEELSFELARDDVLELFAGNRLYGNRNAFVRELLQNSIDAIRLRCVLEHRADPGGLDIRCWEDDDGYIWFRVDDTGTGMDIDAIRDYFLRVGRSYYNSAELDTQIRRSGSPDTPFTAISRFGIGVISCFMLGDKIEVSTRALHRRSGEYQALRLTLTAAEDFFVLRRPPQPAPMPAPNHEMDDGYRSDTGTSIAVRIDLSRHDVSVGALTDYAKSSLFYPSCRVTINGVKYEETEEKIARALFNRPRSTTLKGIDGRNSSSYNRAYPRYLGDLVVWVFPLDLTTRARDKRVQGQMAALSAVIPESSRHVRAIDLWPESSVRGLSADIRHALTSISVEVRDPSISWEQVEISIALSEPDVSRVLGKYHTVDWRQSSGLNYDDYLRKCKEHLESHHPDLSPSDIGVLVALADNHAVYQTIIEFDVARFCPEVNTLKVRAKSAWWGHNGIALPIKDSNVEDRIDDREPVVTFRGGDTWQNAADFVGQVALFDDLRPELSLSRAEILEVPFPVLSGMHLAVRQALPQRRDPPWKGAADRVRKTTFLLDKVKLADLGTMRRVIEDPSSDGWKDERVLQVGDQLMNIDEVRKAGAERPVRISFRNAPWSSGVIGMPDAIGSALTQLYLETSWQDGIIVQSSREPHITDGLLYFPPLFFVPYDDANQYMVGSGGPYNARHPFSQWVIENAATMHANAPGHFGRLIDVMRYGFFPEQLEYYVTDRFLADGRNPLPNFISIQDDRDSGYGVYALWLNEDHTDAWEAFQILLDEVVARICVALPSIGSPPDRW
jgi:hypothetical protein